MVWFNRVENKYVFFVCSEDIFFFLDGVVELVFDKSDCICKVDVVWEFVIRVYMDYWYIFKCWWLWNLLFGYVIYFCLVDGVIVCEWYFKSRLRYIVRFSSSDFEYIVVSCVIGEYEWIYVVVIFGSDSDYDVIVDKVIRNGGLCWILLIGDCIDVGCNDVCLNIWFNIS